VSLEIRADIRSLSLISNASQLLVLGTSLATYSAFRLVKQAIEEEKPVLMITTGPTRADKLEGIGKMDKRAGEVLRAYLDELIK
jgi:NAD-dependent deacetylase sirtuin 4